jgi:hypothetical protein
MNRQWGPWGHPHSCSYVCVRERSEKNSEGVSSVQGVKTRENRIVRFLKPDSPVFLGQPKLAFDNLSIFQGYT